MSRSRPLTLKGRHWFGLWLLIFLVVAAAVLVRQQAAWKEVDTLQALRNRHAALEARQAELTRAIQQGTRSAALLPKVARLGLDMPRDTALSFLRVEPEGDRRER